MKNLNFFLVALSVIFGALSFTACVKEDFNLVIDPAGRQNRTIVEFGKLWGIIIGGGRCESGSGICLKFGPLHDHLLSINELDVKPTIQVGPDSTEALVFKGEVAYENLSEEVRNTLLNRRVMEITEDVPVNEEIVKEAYTNSRLSFKGQQFTMRRGVVKIDGPKPDGQRPPYITITITVSKDGISIKIEW